MCPFLQSETNFPHNFVRISDSLTIITISLTKSILLLKFWIPTLLEMRLMFLLCWLASPWVHLSPFILIQRLIVQVSNPERQIGGFL